MIKIGIGNCLVQIHFSFFVLLAFCNLFGGLENGSLLLLSVLVHEAAHILLLLYFRYPPEQVKISGLGLGLRLPPGIAIPYGKSALVSLSGPCANLMLAAAAYGAGVQTLFAINLSLGLFHLLPVPPLDGGLALKSALCFRYPPEKAEKISFILSFLILLPVMLAGFLVLLHTKNNFSLLAVSIYLMLYLLFKNGTFDL